MAIPVDQDGRVLFGAEEEINNFNSRDAGGQVLNKSYTILVDVREFRSSLPSLIHARRIKIIPCTLEVGDYILSPRICVERKSISDLVQSLKSGRLYTQCESMTTHYDEAVLLIEFEASRSFRLLHGKNQEHDVAAKLSLLLIHFPKLKIIWSCGAFATADIFKDLKVFKQIDLQERESEPVMETAMAIGVESTITHSAYNITPSSMLQAMPGINFKNYRHVMDRVKNIRELSDFSLEQCQGLVGTENGRLLYKFFRVQQKLE